MQIVCQIQRIWDNMAAHADPMMLLCSMPNHAPNDAQFKPSLSKLGCLTKRGLKKDAM